MDVPGRAVEEVGEEKLVPTKQVRDPESQHQEEPTWLYVCCLPGSHCG